MPLYEYQCECGNEAEVRLPFEESNQFQACECGKIMQRKMSLSSFTFKQYGNQMALDTLNDKQNGMPNRHWKAKAEQFAAAGL